MILFCIWNVGIQIKLITTNLINIMLAYELYLRNKDSTANVVKQQKPIKKIFVNKGKVTLDKTTIDEYGSETVGKYRILQESLAMPLNTSDRTLLNLPDSRTSSSQPNPYVEIYGTLKVTNMKATLLLQITGRSRTDGEKREVLGLHIAYLTIKCLYKLKKVLSKVRQKKLFHVREKSL